jgi:hypothetical protein
MEASICYHRKSKVRRTRKINEPAERKRTDEKEKKKSVKELGSLEEKHKDTYAPSNHALTLFHHTTHTTAIPPLPVVHQVHSATTFVQPIRDGC